MNKPKILLLDVETKPLQAYVWSIWNQNVGINQIHTDWNLLSWSAKWLGSKEIFYQDLRDCKNAENDYSLMHKLWKLMDEADIIVGHNLRKFDIKRINARLIVHGFKPPSGYKMVDTYSIAKRRFGFTSNKLEYLAQKLCVKHKKSQHRKFVGFELWLQCMDGNKAAWKEMQRYNEKDVLVLEELYNTLMPWDSSINYNLYHDELVHVCKCGSEDFKRNGFHYTAKGKYQRYACNDCGCECRDSENLFSQSKSKSLRL